MSDISPGARALLRRALDAGGPTQADYRRVKRAVLVATVPAVGVGFAAKAVASTFKSVVAFTLAASVGAGTVVGGTSLVNTISSHMTRAPSKRTTPEVFLPVKEAPAPNVEPIEVSPLPIAMEPMAEKRATIAPVIQTEPAMQVSSPRVGAPVVETRSEVETPSIPLRDSVDSYETNKAIPREVRATNCELAAELSAVSEAHRQLFISPKAALRELNLFEEECPHGTLAEERSAIRAIALCEEGDTLTGRQLYKTLQENHPQSPSLGRVAKACGFL